MTDIVVPVPVQVALTHAEVQLLASQAEVDVLHIKGPALDKSLRKPWPDNANDAMRTSTDADVLVRPAHLHALETVLKQSDWDRLYDFADGSAFEHAATWVFRDLASLDVHRYFPGIEFDAEEVFDVLWNRRAITEIAGISCPVPDLDAQRLIVLIHAARGQSMRDSQDRGRAWSSLDSAAHSRIDELADRIGATVALRAGTGRLESVRDARTYPLWRHLVSGDVSRLSLWWARVRSAPNVWSGARVGVRMLVPNRRRLEAERGRPLSGRELVGSYLNRSRYAAITLMREVAKRRKGR